MNRLGRMAQRLFNVPLMCREEKLEMIMAALADRIGIAKLDKIDGTSLGAAELKQMASDEIEADRPRRRLYELRDGIARIPVDGTLAHKLGGVEPWSGMVGYDQLDRKLTAAREDQDVRAILFDSDTPGGETAGCFEFAKKIFNGSARFGGKPVYWLANEMACSAGYALASACDRIAIPESGITGSIGVWTMLVDFSDALDADGIKVRIVRAGDRKARGHPAEGWDEETEDKLQAWVEETWGIFARLVAAGRGGTAEDYLALEGDWFPADEALELGLVDVIASPDEVFDEIRRDVARMI